jgi:hypothetical protein
MAGNSNRHRASYEPRGAAPALARGGDRQFLHSFYRFPFVSDDPLCISRLIQWNPAPALATTPAMPGDSSGSYSYSPSPSSCYSDRDAHRFKAERDETQHRLGDVSKKAGIAELEWEHQRKQLLETIDGESRDLF